MFGRRGAFLLALTAWGAAGVLFFGGCATPSEEQSDIPWNIPQRWEGSPAVPGGFTTQ